MRVNRVSQLIKERLSKYIFNDIPEEIGIVTITDIFTSNDLKNSTIYFTCLDKSYINKILSILIKKTPKYQQRLGSELKIRYSPKLNFKADNSLEQINKVEEILKKIK